MLLIESKLIKNVPGLVDFVDLTNLAEKKKAIKIKQVTEEETKAVRKLSVIKTNPYP